MTLTTQDSILLISVAGGVFGAFGLVVRAITRSSCKEFSCCYGMIKCFRDTGAVGPAIDEDDEYDNVRHSEHRHSRTVVMEVPALHDMTSRSRYADDSPNEGTL